MSEYLFATEWVVAGQPPLIMCQRYWRQLDAATKAAKGLPEYQVTADVLKHQTGAQTVYNALMALKTDAEKNAIFQKRFPTVFNAMSKIPLSRIIVVFTTAVVDSL